MINESFTESCINCEMKDNTTRGRMITYEEHYTWYNVWNTSDNKKCNHMPPEKTHDSLREEQKHADTGKHCEACTKSVRKIPVMNDWTDTEKVLHNLFTKIHDSAYSAGIQKGLDMAMGAVPEEAKSDERTVPYPSAVYGWNECRSQVLESLEKLRGE